VERDEVNDLKLLQRYLSAAVESTLMGSSGSAGTKQKMQVIGACYLAAIEPLAPGAIRITDKLPQSFIFAGLNLGWHSCNHRRMPMPYRATLPVRSKRGAVHAGTQNRSGPACIAFDQAPSQRKISFGIKMLPTILRYLPEWFCAYGLYLKPY
jgi:hypothetical protein